MNTPTRKQLFIAHTTAHNPVVNDAAGAHSSQSIDERTRGYAADVLADLPLCRLTASGWELVLRQLETVAQALDSADSSTVQAAVLDLDFLAPRSTRLGQEPVVPAPQRVRLVFNRLIHDLGPDAFATAPATFGPPPPPVPAPGVTDPELVIHLFAPMDDEAGEAAFRQLTRVWQDCRSRLGADTEVPRLGLPTTLPEKLGDLPRTHELAAVTRPDGTVQAILRREHDVLVLSVLCAAAPGSAQHWPDLEQQWAPYSPAAHDTLIGVTRLYLGVTAEPGQPREPARHVAVQNGWDADKTTFLDGWAVLEAPTVDDLSPDRVLVVLAGAGADERRSAWLWSRGDAATTPFIQYLTNAAKVRYEARVRRAVGESVHIGSDESPAALTTLASKLSDMVTTVEVARHNMGSLVGTATRTGFVAEDAALADWLHRQLAADLAYVTNERDRRRSTRAVTPRQSQPVFGLVTALEEEFIAVRQLLRDARPVTVAHDRGVYVEGWLPSTDREAPHEVVLTLLADTATNAAAEAVAQLVRSFPSVDQLLMVGIAAGVPAPHEPPRHVRLGDVIAATWGVVAYDHVVERPDGPVLRQPFPPPSLMLVNRAKILDAEALIGRRPWEPLLDQLIAAHPLFARPPAQTDQLHDGDSPELIAHPDPALSGHPDGYPKIHLGAVGSASRSVRHAGTRDELARRYGIRGIEMEAAGVGTAATATGREWFMVRGVSDYADHHMTLQWRRYAAAAAAAYTVALLEHCPPIAPHGGHVRGTIPD